MLVCSLFRAQWLLCCIDVHCSLALLNVTHVAFYDIPTYLIDLIECADIHS